MAYPTLNPPINFPKPLQRNPDNSGNVFPSDLIPNKGFYTQIQFVKYSVGMQFNNFGVANPVGGIKLPIPQKVNDNLVLQWSQLPLADSALGALRGAAAAGGQGTAAVASGLSLAAQLGGVAGGVALNPLMFLQFQRPNFREFSFSWLLTPRNQQETKAIRNIIIQCKKAASPERFGPFLMSYPMVAMIKMHPNNLDGLMKFKPCIITSVQSSYTAGPVPSFYKSGAPAIVSLTLNLMEMQYWFASEIK